MKTSNLHTVAMFFLINHVKNTMVSNYVFTEGVFFQSCVITQSTLKLLRTLYFIMLSILMKCKATSSQAAPCNPRRMACAMFRLAQAAESRSPAGACAQAAMFTPSQGGAALPHSLGRSTVWRGARE